MKANESVTSIKSAAAEATESANAANSTVKTTKNKTSKANFVENTAGELSFVSWLGVSEAPSTTPAITTQTVQQPLTQEQDSLALVAWLSQNAKEALSAQVLQEVAPTQATEEEPETPLAKEKPPLSKPSAQADELKETKQSVALWQLPANPLAHPLLAMQTGQLSPALTQALNAVNGEGETTPTAGAGFFALQEKVSKWLQQAHSAGRPIRLDLDEQTALFLRIRQGKVSAEWLLKQGQPSQVAALAAQVEALRQRLSEQDLPVEQFTVRPEQGQNRQQQRQPSQQEQGNENEEE
jgi:hypothetical protein